MSQTDPGSGEVIVGLDIGKSRTGVARADATLTLASPLTVLDTEPVNSLHARLAECLGQVRVGLLVSGLPLDRTGKEGAAAEYIREVGETISSGLDTPVEYIDERFTTREMQVRRGEAGFKASNPQGQIDAWAAASILQCYLDSRLIRD